MNFIIIGLLLR